MFDTNFSEYDLNYITNNKYWWNKIKITNCYHILIMIWDIDYRKTQNKNVRN